MLRFAGFSEDTIDKQKLNEYLKEYDRAIFEQLDLILEKVSEKSKALASNLKRCLTKMRDTDRYLRAFYNQPVAIKENELTGEEFLIFREYVRLLRSCTIMCGPEASAQFKKLFLDFFAGARVELAREYGAGPVS